MAWGVKNGWHPPVGSFTKKSDATRMAKQMREANKQAGVNAGSVRVVKVTSNPAKSGIAKAVATLMKKVNPGKRITAVRMKRLAGGGVSITPL